MQRKDFGVIQKIRSLETSNFCLPHLSIHVHFICDPRPPSIYVCSSELPHPLSKMTMFYIYCIYIYICNNNKNICKSGKKFEKTRDRFDLPPFARFRLLFKRTHPSLHSLLHDERWTLYLKKSGKYINVKRKNKEEMEGVHDDASAYMHLNIKAHR